MLAGARRPAGRHRASAWPWAATVAGLRAPTRPAVSRRRLEQVADECEGQLDVLLVGHDRAAQGHRPRPGRRATRRSVRVHACCSPACSASASDTVYLSPAPLYHAAPAGWTTGTQRLGGTVVVMERFDPLELLAAIERHRVTHVQFVPTHLVRLLKLPPEVRARYDLSSLQLVVHAAAPCPRRGQAGRARVARTDHPRVLRRQRGRRLLRHRAGGVARRTPARSASRCWAPSTSWATTATSCRPARRARSGSSRRAASSTTATRPRPRPRGTTRGLEHPRRRRHGRRRGLPVPHRPGVEHDHLGRREHLPTRDRGRARGPPRRRRRRR